MHNVRPVGAMDSPQLTDRSEFFERRVGLAHELQRDETKPGITDTLRAAMDAGRNDHFVSGLQSRPCNRLPMRPEEPVFSDYEQKLRTHGHRAKRGSYFVILPVPIDKPADAFFDRRVRTVTDLPGKRLCVGAGGGDVAGLHGQATRHGLTADLVFQHFNQSRKFYGLVISDVEDTVWQCALGGVFAARRT